MNQTTATNDRGEIAKPRKVIVPVASGLSWGAEPGFCYQEKLDGRFEVRRVRARRARAVDWDSPALGDTSLAGENVGGEFYAFDLLKLSGEDCRPWPLAERLTWLDQVFQQDLQGARRETIHRLPTVTEGGNLLAAVLARSGEGVVRKRLDSPWGTPMEACKRVETFTCLVTGFNAGQSVQIARVIAGSTYPAGSVALLGGKCDRVRVGSILKIEGFGLTRDGKIREPRPCKDTPTSWLVQY